MTADLRYLLDTNVVSDLVRQPQGAVAARIVELGADRVCTSIVVACEARFGAVKSGSERLARQLALVLEHLETLPLESPVDAHYADIRNTLERAGTPIGPNDLLIAAHARALGLIVVTRNVAEFSRVPGLIVEDWTAASFTPTATKAAPAEDPRTRSTPAGHTPR